MKPIPIVDIFAGPGGLSEGFASLRDGQGNRRFDVRLSIEKDAVAHRTLELRAMFRKFEIAPDIYYDYLKGHCDRDALFSSKHIKDAARAAQEEAWCFTLSEENHALIAKRVRNAIAGVDTWVLIGGPPCQAYSLVGRSRMRSSAPRKFERDVRHFLYREYLQILADHAPPVFVMENVKGLLSATVGGQRIFEQILSDLSHPNGGDVRYRVVPLSSASDMVDFKREDFVIKSEESVRSFVCEAYHVV